MALKIKITLTASKAEKLYEGDDIPDGIYLDNDDDIVVSNDGDVACFTPGGLVLPGRPEYPLVLAPKGTKIEITN